MIESIVICKTLPDAYHKALVNLHECGQFVPCPDWNTSQKEMSMTMVVKEPLAEPMISRLFIGGPRELEQYRQEVLYGILDFEIDKCNWTYTYHNRMVNYDGIDQIQFVIDELRRNPYSRRAVIAIRDVKVDISNNDPACMQHIQYFIRNNRLDCSVLFRSNDACKATFMNAFALIMLQKYIADELGCEVGSYTHRANSFHCYERDFDMLNGYVKRILDYTDITYDYNGDWDTLMDEAKPDIDKMIKELS